MSPTTNNRTNVAQYSEFPTRVHGRPYLLSSNRKLRHLQGISIRNITLTPTSGGRSRGRTIDDESLPTSLRSPAKILSQHDTKKLEHSHSYTDLKSNDTLSTNGAIGYHANDTKRPPAGILRRRSTLNWSDASPDARQKKLEDVIGARMPDTWFSLHCPGLEDPIYVSEMAKKAMNPNFQFFDLNMCGPAISRLDELTVKLWAKSETMDNFILLLELHMHLRSLQFIGKTLEGFHHPLPPNCIIFHLPDGIYTNFVDIPPETTQPPLRGQKSGLHGVQPTSSYDYLMRLSNLDDCIQDALATREKLASDINKILEEHGGFIRILRAKEEKQEAVKSVQRLVQLERKQVRQATLKRTDLQLSLRKRREAMAKGRQTQANAADFLSSNQSKLKDCKGLVDKNTAIKAGQIRRISEDLMRIYPIEPVSNKPLAFTIAGLPLPISSAFEEVDEAVTAAALGYVAHLVHLLALYLSIPLYYPIKPFSSHSLISDPISQSIAQRTYLLHPSARYKFEYGVFLLNKDIELLINRQNLKVLDIRHTLPNLKYLIYVLTAGDGELPTRRAGSLRGLMTPGGTGGLSRRGSQESTNSEVGVLARQKLESEGMRQGQALGGGALRMFGQANRNGNGVQGGVGAKGPSNGNGVPLISSGLRMSSR
ncbi:MAG: hypothetical protein M1834_001013 [Cirrosporium novae-zelandiae]|nr:MAG: hypothetical protein M1834_001013 [Cirrosporium novae-zelandiae]